MNNQNKKFVVGQIGCGAMASDVNGPVALVNPYVAEIKWACDISGKNAKAFAEKMKMGRVTGKFADVTEDPEVDIVCIATTHEARVPIIESAAAHGKHIFCEKPLAMTEKECYDIIRAVRRAKVKLCVDYMRRLAPAVTALKREWRQHQARPKRQPWRYIETAHDRLEEEKATDFLVRVQDESASYRMVHLDPFHGGGLIIGEAAHWLDLACWLFDNERPVEVRAWGSTRMRYGIHLAFQSGNAATIIMTPNGTFDYPKEMYEIACDGALFRMEFFLENQYYGRPGKEREVFPMARDPLPKIGKEGGMAGFMKKRLATSKGTGNMRKVWHELQADHGYTLMFNGFIDSILENTRPPCDEMDGYRATFLSELAMKSVLLNQPLPVPAEKWDYYVHLD